MHLPGVLLLQSGGLGATDCETIGTGLLAQPVNAISSLAYLAVGLWILRRRPGGVVPSAPHRPFGWAVIGVGLGSFLFHGPMPPGSRWLHDVSIVVVLAMLVVGVVGRYAGGRPGVVVVVVVTIAAAIMMLAPESGLMIIAVLAVLLFGVEMRTRVVRDAPPLPGWLVWSGVLVAMAATLQLLGRTGGPWCAPGSLLQAHAAWHVLTALALGVYGPAVFAAEQ